MSRAQREERNYRTCKTKQRSIEREAVELIEIVGTLFKIGKKDMTVIAILPTNIAIAVNGNELVVERTAPQCSHIKGHTPTIGHALLHWQSLGRFPRAKNIGIAYKMQALATAQTGRIDREGYTAVIPVDGWFVKLCLVLVEETEKVGAGIATGRRIEPHVVYYIVAVHAVETQGMGSSGPFGAETLAIKAQLIAIVYIGIAVVDLHRALPPPFLHLTQWQ